MHGKGEVRLSKQYGGAIVSRNGLALLHNGEAYYTRMNTVINMNSIETRKIRWRRTAKRWRFKLNQPVKVTFS